MSATRITPAPALWGVVPAAGVGRRFAGTDLPKQYCRIGAMTMLEHSVRALLECREVRSVVIAVHPDDTRAGQLSSLQQAKIRWVAGGAERADSVLQALHALQGQAAEHDWVLVHDAARPCLTLVDLARLVDALRDDPVGGILAVPAVDTLKRVSGGTIEQTVDRSQIWQAQTPQMFRFGLLRDCLQSAAERCQPVTDEASAVEAAGYSARVVAGARGNIKVTYPDDLALAAFYLQQESLA